MCVNNLSKVALDSAAAGIEPATSSHKSNALTTAPPSYTMHNTYTAPHTRTWQLLRRCRVTEREDVQSVSCRLSPHTWASSLCSQTATCSSGLHPRNPSNSLRVFLWCRIANGHDGSWLTNSQAEMLSVHAGNSQSSCPVVGGAASCSTHRGPAALKLRSPKLLCVRGMKHVLAAAECSGLCYGLTKDCRDQQKNRYV